MVTMNLPKKLQAKDNVEVETDRDFSIDNWNGKTGFKNWDYNEERR